MILGTVVNIGGTEYTVPPFTIGQWERYDALAKTYDSGDDKGIPHLVRTFAPLLSENVQRNHADFALAAEDWDVPTFMEVRAACVVTTRQANPQTAPANLSTGAI